MRVIFARSARRDLVGVIDHIALDNPVAAARVFRAIIQATERLAEFPNLGHPGRLADDQRVSVPPSLG